nr:unnamed protein product [Digitaria exilis]
MGAEPEPVPVNPAAAAVVFLVPFPAHGHVSPMLRLARALAARGVAATVAVPDFVHRRIVGAGVELASIESGVPDDGEGEPPGFASFAHSMEHRTPASLEAMLLKKKTTPRHGDVAACLVIADVLASWAVPVAARCGVPAVGFWPAMLATYRVVAAIPELIDKGLISDLELELSTAELPWLVGDAACQKSRFTFWLRTMERAKGFHAILVNTFPGEVIGDSAGKHLLHASLVLQILQVGPLPTKGAFGCDDTKGDLLLDDSPPAKNPSMWQTDETCMEWLDQQREGSVIYVSFGSWVASIGPDAINELALGLEATGRPFMWALKDEPSWREGLPRQYTSGSIAGRGKIVGWAPQEDVLQHKAVGCYLTHCGWNSTLEAIQHGMRLLCYPVAGDQFINCAYIVKMWQTGIRLWSTERSVVEDCVERIMDGEEGRRMQEKVVELRERVLLDETRCAAKRNLDSFVDGIMRDDLGQLSL